MSPPRTPCSAPVTTPHRGRNLDKIGTGGATIFLGLESWASPAWRGGRSKVWPSVQLPNYVHFLESELGDWFRKVLRTLQLVCPAILQQRGGAVVRTHEVELFVSGFWLITKLCFMHTSSQELPNAYFSFHPSTSYRVLKLAAKIAHFLGKNARL